MTALAPAVLAQEPVYDVVDLGPVPGQVGFAGVTANGISPDGSHVCGTSVWEGYVWDRARGMSALPKPAGSSVVSAEGVNDRGLAVGSTGLAVSSQRAVVWRSAGRTLEIAHDAGWVWSRAVSVNNADDFVLTAGIPGSAGTASAAFLSRVGTAQFLRISSPAATSSAAVAINDDGLVLYEEVPGGGFLRDAQGVTTSLGTLYDVQALSQGGQVAGLDDGRVGRWSPAAGWQVLPEPTLNFRRLGGINRFGQVVASHTVQVQTSPPRFDHFAHVHTDGIGWTALGSLVDPGLFVDLEITVGITDEGAIVAYGSIGPDNRALLLRPRLFDVFGAGCETASGTLRALASGDPRPGGKIAFLAAGAAPGATGALLIGLRRTAVPVLGCDAYVADAFAIPVTADADGRIVVPVDVSPAATGTRIFAQFVAVDPGFPTQPVALSNGMGVRIP